MNACDRRNYKGSIHTGRNSGNHCLKTSPKNVLVCKRRRQEEKHTCIRLQVRHTSQQLIIDASGLAQHSIDRYRLWGRGRELQYIYYLLQNLYLVTSHLCNILLINLIFTPGKVIFPLRQGQYLCDIAGVRHSKHTSGLHKVVVVAAVVVKFTKHRTFNCL